MPAREMYMLTLDGKPVVVVWAGRTPLYRTVGQTVFPVWLYKTLATVKRHATIASKQGGVPLNSRYGYVIVKVPA